MTRIDAATAARLCQGRQPAKPRQPKATSNPGVGLGSDGERALETQLRQTGATGWVRELQFDAARQWRFDFAWTDEGVAVEVEGGTWIGGHGGARFRQDCLKYAEAAIQGWTVIRVTTDMVDDGTAITLIGRLLWSTSQRRNR